MNLFSDPARSICRIVDTRDSHVGTVVLVSDRGREFGYALTCWHNFDPGGQLAIRSDGPIDGVFLIPNSGLVDASEHRRPVVVVAEWSNSRMDIAVLKIPRAVIVAFGLQPMPITFDLRRGLRLTVTGFERPGELRRAGVAKVKVVAVDHGVWVEDWQTELQVFEVTSLDHKAVPFDAGMSGAPMIAPLGALVGFAEAVAPNETGSHRSLAYGVSIATIARTWTLIADHCFVTRSHPVRRWLRTAAAILVGLGSLAGLALAGVAALNGLAPGHGATTVSGVMPSSNVGKRASATATFSVHRWYGPTGLMGDIGDLTIGKGGGADGGDRFSYRLAGQPPHQWEYSHDPDVDPDQPTKFAGVMYLSPSNCWGLTDDCGYDLRGFRRLSWEARSVNELEPMVEFVVGTDNKAWRHRDGRWEWATVRFPGTLTAESLGSHALSREWRRFDVEFEPTQDRRRVIGGFGWLMTWGANDADGDRPPTQIKTFVFEIRNIRYER